MGLINKELRPLPELIQNISELVSDSNKTVNQLNDLIQKMLSNGIEVSIMMDGKEIPVQLKFKIPA